MKPKILNLRFPLGGLNRRAGFQSQAQYTTTDALNVRPDSVQGMQERGGCRPGIGPSHRGTLGGRVRMLACLDVIETTGLTYWQDTFDGDALGSDWATASWLTRSPLVEDGQAYCQKRHGTTGAVRAAFPTLIDTAKDYIVEMFISTHRATHSAQYKLFVRMDDSSPDVTTAGVAARLALNADGTFSGELTVDGSTTHAFTSGDDGAAQSGWFTVKVSGNNVSAYWRNATLISGQAVGTHSGQRVGFGMYVVNSPAECRVDAFRVQYYLTGGNQRTNRRALIASAEGNLYKEDWLGNVTQVSSSVSLASDRTLRAQQRLQKLYIADCGEWKSAGTGTGARGAGNAKFDATGVSDWTTIGIDTDDDVLVIYDSSNTETLLEGVYKISSVASGELTLTTDCATTSGATCSWYITRAPKVYDYATNTLAQWTATTGKGFVPPTQPIVALYRDRLVLAGGSDSPHLWYMSRQGDPLDWDYGQEDVGRAIAGQNSQAGLIGEPITALCPHGDVCLVIGCTNSTWIMRGDPGYGGQIDSLSRNIGIVDKHAWCYVPNVGQDNAGTLVFLSLDGVYMLPAGCGASEPVSISREKLPEELLHVDKNLVEVCFAYDLLARGVHIWMTKKDSGLSKHWWLDWETKGFFPMEVPAGQQPTAVCEYASFCAEDSCVVLGGRDGKLRRFHKRFTRDDAGTAIESYVDYGPLLLGDQAGMFDGIIAEATPMLIKDGGDVKMSIRAAFSVEAARFASETHTSIHRSDHVGYATHPRARGNAGFIRLSGVNGIPWSVEQIGVRIEPGGKQRRL